MLLQPVDSDWLTRQVAGKTPEQYKKRASPLILFQLFSVCCEAHTSKHTHQNQYASQRQLNGRQEGWQAKGVGKPLKS